MRTITMKFGGTSVGSTEAIANAVDIIESELQAGNRVVVTVSAMAGVTNALLESVRQAASGNRWGFISNANTLRERHEEALTALTAPGADREETLAIVNKLIDDYIELCSAITTIGEASPRIHDAIVSFGERLSSQIVAAALCARGVEARAFFAGDFLITDDQYQNANPLWDVTQQRIEHNLVPQIQDGITPIITGFIGATLDGVITTLGRGGSDFSAAIFAAYTHSDELIIWTDVDGVMTTDPRIDKRARVLPYVSYQEIGELAFYGAKVLHPKTIQPIAERDIALRVCNTFNPSHPGTRIGSEEQPSATIVKAVTAVRNVSMLTVCGRGMMGVPGIAGRTFLAAAQVGGNILMISQASSEQSFCFVTTDDKAQRIKAAIEEELAREIARRDVEKIALMEDVAIITVVGSSMRGTPGVAGRVFSAMGENRINIIAIAQGTSECSISFVIQEDELEDAVIKLHDLALEAVPVG